MQPAVDERLLPLDLAVLDLDDSVTGAQASRLTAVANDLAAILGC